MRRKKEKKKKKDFKKRKSLFHTILKNYPIRVVHFDSRKAEEGSKDSSELCCSSSRAFCFIIYKEQSQTAMQWSTMIS